MTIKLTDQELEVLGKVFTKLEANEYRDSGADKTNLGYVNIQLVDYDNEDIYIDVESGVEGGRSCRWPTGVKREALSAYIAGQLTLDQVMETLQ